MRSSIPPHPYKEWWQKRRETGQETLRKCHQESSLDEGLQGLLLRLSVFKNKLFLIFASEDVSL